MLATPCPKALALWGKHGIRSPALVVNAYMMAEPDSIAKTTSVQHQATEADFCTTRTLVRYAWTSTGKVKIGAAHHEIASACTVLPRNSPTMPTSETPRPPAKCPLKTQTQYHAKSDIATHGADIGAGSIARMADVKFSGIASIRVGTCTKHLLKKKWQHKKNVSTMIPGMTPQSCMADGRSKEPGPITHAM